MRVFRPEFSHLAFRHDRPNMQRMFDENPRGGLPGVGGGEFDAILPRNLQRFQAGHPQILVQDADRRRADHVLRAGDREGGDRHARGERLDDPREGHVGPLPRAKASMLSRVVAMIRWTASPVL